MVGRFNQVFWGVSLNTSSWRVHSCNLKSGLCWKHQERVVERRACLLPYTLSGLPKLGNWEKGGLTHEDGETEAGASLSLGSTALPRRAAS